MSLETAQATFEAVMRHLTETGNGIVLDWASVFQELGIGPGVCGGRVVLEVAPAQGGRLPGFDANAMMEGSGRFTGRRAAVRTSTSPSEGKSAAARKTLLSIVVQRIDGEWQVVQVHESYPPRPDS